MNAKAFLKSNLALISMIVAILIIYNTIWLKKIWLKWDMYDGFFPVAVSISSHLKDGSLPLWEPFVHRGIPLAHLLGAPIWSPLTLFFSLLGQSLYTIQLQFLIIVLLAGYFTYLASGLFVKNTWICAAAGVVYASSGLFVSNAQHLTFISAAAFFPLVYYSFRKAVTEKNRNYYILFGFSIALLLLNSYPPFVVFTLMFIVIELCFLFKTIGNKKEFVINMAIAVLTATLCSLVVVVTTLQIFGEMFRNIIAWEGIQASSLNIWNWFSSISPSLSRFHQSWNPSMDVSMANTYLALPFLLPIFCFRLWDKTQKYLYVCLTLGLLLAAGANTYFYKVFLWFPGVDSFRFPAGLRYFFFFFIILIAARVIDKIQEGNDVKLSADLSSIFKYATIGFLAFFVYLGLLKVTNPEAPFFQIPLSKEIFLTLILFAMALLIFRHTSKTRISLFMFIFILPFSFANVYVNGSYTLGSDVRPEAYDSKIAALYASPSRTLTNQFIAPTAINSEPIFTQQFSTYGYIGTFDLKKFKEAQLNEQLPKDLDPVVYLTDTTGARDIESISSLEWSKNTLTIQATADEDHEMIIEQTYFPGWKAELDGVQTDIQQNENGSMRILMPSGEHEVRFVFQPTLVIISAWITFASWFLLLGYFVYRQISKKRSKISVS